MTKKSRGDKFAWSSGNFKLSLPKNGKESAVGKERKATQKLGG